ncbi:MAG: sugar transferase [Erysipelotrichaceae bacterium]|nr:sugar transferase [Erysipelotrichaceae bacterium]
MEANEESFSSSNVSSKSLYFFIKRIIDIVLSFSALIVLSPVFLIIAIAIKVDDNGPVFYKHMRVGKNGKPLGVYKFRSMTTKYKTFDEFYVTLSDEQKKRMGRKL